MTRLIPEGSWTDELHGHEVKLMVGAFGVVLTVAGVATQTLAIIGGGCAAVGFAATQLAAHCGTATAPATTLSGTSRHVDGEVVQKLTYSERNGFGGYATGRRLEELAGEDTVYVVHDGEPPARTDRWLPWRDAAPTSEWAPVVVMDAERAAGIEEGDRVAWELAPTTLDGVYVREFRGEDE